MIGLILVASLIISCDLFTPSGVNNPSTKIEITSQSLVDTQWEFVSMEVTEQGTHGRETGVYEVPDEEYYIIEFGESVLKGQMFCNSCVSRYEIIPPDSIFIPPMLCSRLSCGTFAPQRQLAHSKTFELYQENLRLFYESDMHGNGNLYFKKMDVE